MNKIANSLALAGHPVPNNEFIMYLLQVIPLEYDAIVANINSQPIPLDVVEVQAFLMGQRMHLQSATSVIVQTANIADKTKAID